MFLTLQSGKLVNIIIYIVLMFFLCRSIVRVAVAHLVGVPTIRYLTPNFLAPLAPACQSLLGRKSVTAL